MNQRLYVAYGSNLNLEQMQYRCPTAVVVGTSEIQDYTLVFRGSKSGSYATIEPQEGSVVPVLIWDIQPEDELKLDAYEGYPDFYYKENLELNLTLTTKKETIPVQAMVYIMPNTFELGTPSNQYIKTIADGYTSANFDKDILYDALEQNDIRINEQQIVDDYEMRW